MEIITCAPKLTPTSGRRPNFNKSRTPAARFLPVDLENPNLILTSPLTRDPGADPSEVRGIPSYHYSTLTPDALKDGPPLRATTLIGYSNYLISQSNTSYVTSKIWPVVKLDLDYTAAYWNSTGYAFFEILRVRIDC